MFAINHAATALRIDGLLKPMSALGTSWGAMALLLPPLIIVQVPDDGCRATDAARSLCAVESALTDALRRNDAAAVARIYGDDFQLINFRGRRVERSGVLTAIETGVLRFDSLTTSELVARVHGNAGIISGVHHQVAREPGGDARAYAKDVRFTNVYVHREGRWVLVSTQIAPIAAPNPPSVVIP